ncbi:MAG: zinc/iron-chelating domain-containing protein [Deltaproteobacteria bacterium]|nr:MAG: zinc/iron-chelating domain-containing protein [Deltaproteobacteria bacterium]
MALPLPCWSVSLSEPTHRYLSPVRCSRSGPRKKQVKRGPLPRAAQPAITTLTKEEQFTFSCHKGVSCFTECCRMLDLILTPYDLLRLRRSTGKTSSELLKDYVIAEQDEGEAFPRFYLSMVDDGRASCVFVSPEGCTVYRDRPGACRAYPLGRGVQCGQRGRLQEHFVLLRESHCQGFLEPIRQDIEGYTKAQGLEEYNAFNDKMAAILQHKRIRNGFIPSKKQIALFTLALYDLDAFRDFLQTGGAATEETTIDQRIFSDDERLLEFAIRWIEQHLYQGL